MSCDRVTRRGFLATTAATSMAIALPATTAAALKRLAKPVRIGVLADLHHDVMHDGAARLGVFVKEMATRRPDAILQLGDFAYPNAHNKEVIERFNQAHERSLHVIGNHDMDSGHTRRQCYDRWGMTGRYYAQDIDGLWLLVLDGNDTGSPTHQGGYASYIGEEQCKWLAGQLARLPGPAIVVSHQPLAGAFAVDNAEQVQRILTNASDKVLLALNGHSHIDALLRVESVTYMHMNSASYQWVGSAHQHASYAEDVHAKYPWISHTCPYRDPLFATLTIDPEDLTIQVDGRESEWVGKSPGELGVELHSTLTDGKEVAPRIRDRRIVRKAQEACPLAGDRSVALLLKKVRQKHRVPAIAGAIVTREGVAAVAAVGVRKRGTTIPVTLDDQWHLGSCTKAMVATLVARLVEQGQLRWETTIAEVFPDWSATFHADMRIVSVAELLSHRAGLPKNLDLAEYRGASAPSERRRAVRQELTKPPRTQPGSTYHYSNLGYIIVGAIVERLTGKSWEQNMIEQVFGPLAMAHTGFGGVGTPGNIDQPWGHTADGKPVRENGPSMDNPPVMGPAGRVHCSVEDWAKFVADHLRGARGDTSMLSSATYETLHTPSLGSEYALGWIVAERDWGGGTVLHHGGSNTMNYANVWIAPQRGFAVLACVNQGGERALKASDAAVAALIDHHHSKRSAQH